MRSHNIYSSPGIIRVTETRRMGWAGHVARVLENRNAYVVYGGGNQFEELSVYVSVICNGKGKGTVHPRTGHEGSEGSKGIALLFL